MKRHLLALAIILAPIAGHAQDVFNPQTNASALSTGTLPAGRMPALTGDCTTSAGAVATNCTKTGGVAFGGYATISAGMLTNAIGANVALNSTSTFFTGPTVAQGSTGTWCAIGQVTLNDSAGAANFNIRLWDGTTVMASAFASITAANKEIVVPMAGCLASPAGNIRIDVKDTATTTGVIIFNDSGLSKDSTLSVYRVN